jgi:serine kinase of HPr protein (carbohydrate metabolism regulator)
MAGFLQPSIYSLLRKLEAIFLFELPIAVVTKNNIATKDILPLHAKRNRIVLMKFQVQMSLTAYSLTASQNQILIDFLDNRFKHELHGFLLFSQ